MSLWGKVKVSHRLVLIGLILASFACASARRREARETKAALHNCNGRKIFVHDLPSKFNKGLMLQRTDYNKENKKWYTEQMLRVLERIAENSGFGSSMRSPVLRPVIPDGWYKTDQFALEVIFYSRMRMYPCRTLNHTEADLVYVPYFGGLDMTRHMHEDNSVKESLARDLSVWIQAHPAWQRNNGLDHFWVLGRETWDFHKNPDGIWGNNLLNLHGIKGRVITINGETTPWFENEFCAPKPTAFHPRSMSEMQAWVRSVRSQERPFLFSFVAGRRKNNTAEGLLRQKLFWQCAQSGSCYLGDCDAQQRLIGGKWVAGCESPRFIMRVYLKSTFCLHPRGDSCNRRSVLDSMMAGCIPVVFEECTLQHQYGWHVHSGIHDLGSSKFYVHIPYEKVRGEYDDGGVDSVLVEDVLERIPEEELSRMRKKVLELIPRITYGGRPKGKGVIEPPDFKDAFDIIIDGLIQVRNRNVQAS